MHCETSRAYLTSNMPAPGPSGNKFFKAYLDVHPEAAEDVDKAENATALPASGPDDCDNRVAARLRVRATRGQLTWGLDDSLGTFQSGLGDCDKKGVAGFGGTRDGPSGESLVGGTYELSVQATACTLSLYGANGELKSTFTGNGYVEGLETTYGKPWKGTWS